MIITDVKPGSPAEMVGLEAGGIIFRVGNETVNDVREFNDKVAQAARSGEVLLLLRDGTSGRVGYIVVQVG